jgi:DNA polymerase (family 10)
LAQTRGLSLSEYGFQRGDEEILCRTEEEVYRTLDLPWIPPELREDHGELQAAQEGKLPRLVEQRDLRGDLHVHTDWSDGTATLSEMAVAAQRLGYAYLVISDHTQSLGVANGLDAARLRQQRAEIDRLNRGFTRFRLLQGVEVEIRADGSLDFPDDVLREVEVVIASVHLALRQNEEAITARVVRAIRNPNVDVIGHPSGRLLGEREASRVDLDRILREAAETGTLLEINSAPNRLDLDDAHVHQAVQLGVPLCINSDAHDPGFMRMVEYGVATARRGWAEARHIVNTWPVKRLLDTLQHKCTRAS